MDEDAAAIGMPAALVARTKRIASGVGGELARFHQLDQVFLLDRRVAFGPSAGAGHAEVLQRG